MAANHNRLCPARDEARHIGTDYRLTEDNTAKDVPDGAIWRAPPFLEVKFIYALLIRCDGRAFDTDIMLFNRIGRVNGDLVFRRIAALD